MIISVEPANPSYSSSADGVLFNKAKTTLIQHPGGKVGPYTISASVTSIGDMAFLACCGLNALVVEAANPNFSSADGVLFDKAKTMLITYPAGKSGSYNTFPATVTSIGDVAFALCCGVTDVTIPDTVPSIGEAAFSGCSGLTAANFMGNAPAMGLNVFDSTDGGFTVRYFKGSTGFTSPIWMGYPAVNIGDSLPFDDHFNSPSIDLTKWGPELDFGPSGQLVQANGHLEFSGTDSVVRRWIGNNASYTQAWEVFLDVNLGNVVLTQGDSHVQVFLGVCNNNDMVIENGLPGDNVSVALDFWHGLPGEDQRSFESYFRTNWVEAENLQGDAPTTSQHASLRLSFNPTGKTVTAWYDADGIANGYSWTVLSSVRVNDPGTSWEMNDTSSFGFFVGVGCGGYTVTASNQVYADNFMMIPSAAGRIPEVTTGTATNITATSTTLNGTVNPNGWASTAQFQYGLTTAYGSIGILTLSPNNGTTPQNVSLRISGLQSGTTYHYRITAANSAGPAPPGADMTFTTAEVPISPVEMVAPKIEISGGNVTFAIQPSVAGRAYQLQYSDTMANGTWQDLGVLRIGDGNKLVITISYVTGVPRRFYRLALAGSPPAPEGFTLIPAGPFQMGDQSSPLVGEADELPVHTVQVSAFYMGKYEVTKEEWDAVRTWGLTYGYDDLAAGNGGYVSKGANHPVHSITWWDVVKWCNARSEKENLTPCYTVSGATYKTYSTTPVCNWSANGYRLPTEAEWEKAARGGVAGKNFPWGTDTISHSQANYYSSSSYACDVSPTRGFHPTYAVGGYHYSSPVGSFAPNGYGLYDMAGNMLEWCWDWRGSYSAGSQIDPRGATSGMYRVYRGGGWNWIGGGYCRAACRGAGDLPSYSNNNLGFRIARSSVR